jgi:hypothetical protein
MSLFMLNAFERQNSAVLQIHERNRIGRRTAIIVGGAYNDVEGGFLGFIVQQASCISDGAGKKDAQSELVQAESDAFLKHEKASRARLRVPMSDSLM